MKLLQLAKSNSFFSNSVYIFLIRFFPSLANVLVLILLSRNLNTNLYGHYQNFWIQLNLLLPFACMGIHLLIITYAPTYIIQLIQQLKTKQYIGYALFLLLPACFFGWLQSGPAAIGFAMPVLYLLSYTLTTILEAFLVSLRRFKYIVLANFMFALCFVLIHYYFLFHGFNLQLLFLYLLLLVIIRLAFYTVISVLQYYKNNNAESSHQPQKHTIAFWLHLGFNDILQITFSWLDKFIISLFLTASLSAIYFNGSMQIPFLPILLSAAGSAALIELSGNMRNKQADQTLVLVNQSAKILSSVVFPVFFFLLLYRFLLFNQILTPKYQNAIPIFTVSLFLLPLRAYNFTTILQNKHKGAIINIGAIMDIFIALALLYPLYKTFGLPGVALSFVISTYIQAIYYTYHAAKLMHVSFTQLIPFIPLAKKLIVFAMLYIALYSATQYCSTPIFSLLWAGVITIIIIAASLYTDLKHSK